MGKMGNVAAPILGRIKRICNGQFLTCLISCALEVELLVPFTNKRAHWHRGKHNVGQKRQKVKKGSDADSDVSSVGDGYLDSPEEVHISDITDVSDSFASLNGEIV